MKFFIALLIAVTLVFPVVNGCKKEVKTSPVKKEEPVKKEAPKIKKVEVKPEVAVQEAPEEENRGYVYDPGDRRDPFMPLIVPKKIVKKTGISGTLESYDISDFRLTAIAKKGSEYFALLAAPDNKSYTVKEGSVIGHRKGKVVKITFNVVTIVEYSKDYTGKMKPRQISLKLHKGEGK